LHFADDSGVTKHPDVSLGDVQRLVAEEVVSVDPLLLVQQEALGTDGQKLRIDELLQCLSVGVELGLVESL
jgi:hypothetical protein